MARRKIPKQGSFDFPNRWGGKRKGAGRKPRGSRAGVSHRTRPFHEKNHPVHVTLRVRNDVAKLRNRTLWRLFREAFEKSKEKFGGRLVEFSIQGNHFHFIIEAGSRKALRRYMQSLAIRLARLLNRHTGRKGKVFRDRYHAQPLATPTQVRNALLYVLNNFRKHAAEWKVSLARTWLDEYSSARWFNGWKDPPRALADPDAERITAAPRTWLLRAGWRLRGLLPVAAVPGAA